MYFKLLDIGMIKANSNLLEKEEDDDDQIGGFPALPTSSTQQPFYDGPRPTPRQKPFQSGSTPVHLMHRFMVNLTSVWLCRCSCFVNIVLVLLDLNLIFPKSTFVCCGFVLFFFLTASQCEANY